MPILHNQAEQDFKQPGGQIASVHHEYDSEFIWKDTDVVAG